MSNQFSIKYRPLTFEDFRGHEKIIDELKLRSLTDNFPQVMLFSGASGVGKDTIAFIVAKTINCSGPKNDKDEKGNAFKSPCNQCRSCKSINEERWGVSTYMIDCANSNKDDMSKIENISMTSTFMGGNKQVFIIDEFQALMNERTKQSVLKLLERPNKNAYFILTTMDLSKVPKAVINRSTHYKLKDLPLPVLSNIVFDLAENLVESGFDIPDAFFEEQTGALKLLLLSAQGSARTLVSNFERIVFGKLWTREDAEEQLNFIDETTIFHCLDLLVRKDKKAFEELNKLSSLEEFFFLSYETLTETEVYNIVRESKNDWKLGMYEKLLKAGRNNLLSLVKFYNQIYENISGRYFKNAFFTGKILEYFSFRESAPRRIVEVAQHTQQENEEPKKRKVRSIS